MPSHGLAAAFATPCLDMVLRSVEGIVGKSPELHAAELPFLEQLLQRGALFCRATECTWHSSECYRSQDPSEIARWVAIICNELERQECAHSDEEERQPQAEQEDETDQEGEEPGLSEYEKMRLANIRRNELMLKVRNHSHQPRLFEIHRFSSPELGPWWGSNASKSKATKSNIKSTETGEDKVEQKV